MSDVAALSFSVDSNPLDRASASLDQLNTSATRADASVEQMSSAVDSLIAALNRNTTATSSLTSSMSQVSSAGSRASAALSGVGSSANSATSNVLKFDQASRSAVSGLNATADAARKAKDAWAELGKQGSDTAFKLDVARKLSQSAQSSASGTGDRQISDRYKDQLITNIGFQAKDFFDQVISGGSPIRAALLQAPQAAAIAQMGGLGAGDVVKGLGGKVVDVVSGIGTFAAKVGVAGSAVAVLGAAALAAAAVQQSYASSQRELLRQVSGAGRASGMSVSDINARAYGAAAAGGVSVSQASQLLGTFGSTGRIGGQLGSDLASTTKAFSLMTGQDVESAGQQLAKAFADPAKGAEELTQQLGFLDAETLENIKNLQAQGDRLGAQRVLFDAYKTSLLDVTQLTSGWSRAFSSLSRAASDAFTATGKAVDHLVTGGDLDTRIKDLQDILASPVSLSERLSNALGGGQRDHFQTQLDDLLKERKNLQEASKRSDLAQNSREVASIVQGYNPQQEQLKKITNDAENIRKNLREGVIDPNGESARTAAGLETSAKRIREDLVQGGTQFANALRSAQFEQRTVGFTQPASRVAGINERAENEIRSLQTSPNDPLLRDYQINSIRERQKVELETARRQATLDENATGGAFSRMSPEVQQQLLAGSNRFGRVPVGVLAAIANIESRGNLDVGYTRSVDENGKQGTAYGLGQITRSTGVDLQDRYGIDRMDRSTMGTALAGVLDMKLDATGGDLTKAIMAYRGSSDPAVNKAYAARVLRDAGQMGDASQLGQVKEQAERVKTLDDEKDKLSIANQYLGINAEKMDAATRAQQILSDARARGIVIDDNARAEAEKLASGMARVSTSLAGTRAGRELDFQDAQLGRDRYDQQAFSQARSVFGDTMNEAYIDRSRTNSQLGDVKNTLTDVSTGFVQALSKGTSAAQAFGQALSKIGDKLINSALDSLISSAFKGVGSGGGLLSGIGSLFGFSSGGVMTSAGPVQLRKYANGGVASSPQMALFGEGSGPEAYVPLPDGKRIPVAMTGQSSGGSSQSSSSAGVSNYYDLRGSNVTQGELDAKIRNVVAANEAERRRNQFTSQAADRKEFG